MKDRGSHFLLWVAIMFLGVCIKMSVVSAITQPGKGNPKAVMYLVLSGIVWWLAWETDHSG